MKNIAGCDIVQENDQAADLCRRTDAQNKNPPLIIK